MTPIPSGLASTSQGRTLRPLTDAHTKSAIDDHGDFHHAMVGVCDLPPCAAHTARSRMRREHTGIRLISVSLVSVAKDKPSGLGLEGQISEVGTAYLARPARYR